MKTNLSEVLKKYLISIFILLFGSSYFFLDMFSSYFIGYFDNGISKEIIVDNSSRLILSPADSIGGSFLHLVNGSFNKQNVDIIYKNPPKLEHLLLGSYNSNLSQNRFNNSKAGKKSNLVEIRGSQLLSYLLLF